MRTLYQSRVVAGADQTSFLREGTDIQVPGGGELGPAGPHAVGDSVHRAELATDAGRVAGRTLALGRWLRGGEGGPLRAGERRPGDGYHVHVGTVWLDEREMVVLRHDQDRFRVELTKLERREVRADEVAVRGAVVVRPTATTFSPPGHIPDFKGVLLTGYVPAQMNQASGYTYGCLELHDCYQSTVVMSQEQMMANQGMPGTPRLKGEYVHIEQRAGLSAMPDALKVGVPVTVRGATGYLDTSGANPVLCWQEPDGRIVRIEGSQVPVEEVLKAAEGLMARP